MINERALDTAVGRHLLLLRMCRRMGTDNPKVRTMLAHCAPTIIAEYHRILAKENLK